MNPTPIPTDTPGIFRCPECDLQNPRPIKKPFIHQCGCYTPPEPRPAKDIDYILKTLCPECPTKHYHAETRTCRCECVHGTPIEFMAERGSCPNNRW